MGLRDFARKVLNLYRRHSALSIARQQFHRDWAEFIALTSSTRARFDLRAEDLYPMLNDRSAHTPFDGHYICHTAWAARALAAARPAVHVDIGSSLYFCAMASAIVPVRFYDFRPPDLRLDNLEVARADLLKLPFPDGSIPSLSCMHVVEHVGLGRYGDPLDPDGDLKAMAELKRVLAPGGSLLFVVPVGRPKLQFNAHRIYSYEQVASCFRGLSLRQFALVPDGPPPRLIVDATKEQSDAQRYGCGCFWWTRGP